MVYNFRCNVLIVLKTACKLLDTMISLYTCLSGSGDWDTVCTDWDGLSEEPGFNSRVGR